MYSPPLLAYSQTPVSDVTSDSLISDMVGREIEDFFGKRTKRTHQDVLLSVRGLTKENVFSDINFDVRRGEVLCFAGLIGARRTDVGLALFGIGPADTGEVLFEGQPTEITSPEQAIALGIAYSSEDRRKLGLAMSMSITANASLPTLRKYLSRFGLIRRGDETAMSESWFEHELDRIDIGSISL